jgi:predicted metal-dependent hydrolase
MQRSLAVHDKNIEYTLRVSNRARQMRIAVYCDGSTVVTIPRAFPETMLENFIVKRSQWILDKVNYFRTKGLAPIPKRVNTKKEYLKYKDEAFRLAESRLKYFNQFYGHTWSKITIKTQKTRWGSCSKKGNLNFNYKIAHLPPHVADYIIVHELCHLGQFNHSHKFWDLVAKTIPNHIQIRRELKKDWVI